MGSKGKTTTTPKLPSELSGLYSQTAANIMEGQRALPLFGGAGTGTATPRGDAGGRDEDGGRRARRRVI